jgi:histone H3
MEPQIHYTFSIVIDSAYLRTLSTDTTGELNVLGHDGHTLGVNGAQVGILEKTYKVSLSCFLKSKDCRSLETKIRLEVLSNLTHKTLEGQLADEKVSGLLVTADLTKSDSSGAITVGLLDSSSGRSRLACCLGGELLTGSLSSSGLACGLFGTGHFLCFDAVLMFGFLFVTDK